jgi:hypothetical protein
MDPQVYARQRYAEVRPSLAWKRGTKDEMRAWQEALRGRIRQLIGGVSIPRTPLKSNVHEVRDFPQYRRETVRFDSRPGLEVLGYFLTPMRDGKPIPGRLPSVLCLPGHGRGVDSIVGMAEDGSQRPWGAWGEYQADFALQCVSHGYAVFAIEQISFGRRRDAEANKQGGGASSCTRDSPAALMLGETMTGWRVWDAMRSLDYLQTRPEVDPQRLATMGISGGGLTSLWTAALDDRVKVAVVSGYLNTFRDSILAVDHCIDNYVPGLLEVIEMPDLTGLVAPRALFAESGTKDPIFPLPAFRQAVARATDIYRAFGVPAHFGSEEFEGEHQFLGVGAFAFLKERL